MADLKDSVLASRAFPWIGSQLIKSGCDSRNPQLGQLGTQLFLLANSTSGVTPTSSASLSANLHDVVRLLEKACSLSGSWGSQKNDCSTLEMIASRDTLSKEDGERLQYELDKSLKVFSQTNLAINALTQLIQRCEPRQDVPSYPVVLDEGTLHPSASVLMAGEGYKTSGRVAPVPRTLLDPPRALSKWTPKFWLAQVERINRMLHPLSMRDHDAHPVRIAVFDTGYSLDSSYLDMYTHEEKRLSGHWVDWVENSRTPVDVDGHGTAMTSLLMKMTQKAEIFTAILHAATTLNVDIISLSLGFPNEDEIIRDAISEAIRIKKGNLLFFAAAANDGSNRHEMFPASMESVISVRATNSAGGFVDEFDPPPVDDEGRLYGTLGHDIPGHAVDETKPCSGCSAATPIMAGIAALLLQYVQHRLSDRSASSENIRKQIRTKRGMMQIFKAIAVNRGNQRHYVAPFEFFERDDEIRLAIIRVAIANLRTQVVRK
ncbi:S8/S53 family peptidase [Aspergillus vadensis CBS 113365]|uniref:Subtilisin-like protein n=1 Tax=Aspergillus vadensis (strain CBS 113365 / IMI 142717 / IBT 24658) TaxID=1448311 RepID=A0A319B0U0_ASPVC|nr:subtilisin-like protein [Aspergillus vadensis CBS 113365]PYH63780.1 subtilisin-like protein [Aspergillus vadensis CBS 113365]